MAKRFKSNDVKPGTCSRHPAILGLPKFDYNADFESRKLKNCIFQKKNNEEEIFFLNQKGFTLIELISVMIIMGVMSSVAVKKVDFITDTASTKALVIAVKELNVRESLVWSNMKISIDGYSTDVDLFAALDKNLGAKLKWNPGPAIDGGTLHCESQSIALNRTPSTTSTAGKWQ